MGHKMRPIIHTHLSLKTTLSQRDASERSTKLLLYFRLANNMFGYLQQ